MEPRLTRARVWRKQQAHAEPPARRRRPDSARGRVLVAMSGGVDWSLAAALLHEAGYDVVGVTLHLWTPAAKTKLDAAARRKIATTRA